eukprot:TRINITY_DN5051_c0_g1_i2.p1 TRINITY_DN5051_c0_g1~~TRINITY_DN5051_c0_g1_i2.p1  ORF type:complete len:326 (+),score=29.60 TRINITY_DN5051_c0_g1_i2:50-1027(+)
MQYFVETLDWRHAFKFEVLSVESYARGKYTTRQLGTHSGMCLVANLNANSIFVGGSEGLLKIYDRYSYQLSTEIRVHDGNVRAIGFAKDFVATGGADNTVKFVDTATETLLHTFQDHSGEVNDVQCDETIMASSSDDNTTKIYDIRSHQLIQTVDQHQNSVYAHQFDDKILVTGTNGSHSHVFDRRMSYQSLHTFSCGATDLWFDNSNIFLSHTNLQTFNTSTFEHDGALSFELGGTCFSMDASQRMVAVSVGDNIFIIDRNQKAVRRSLRHGSRGIYGIAFDSHTMISGGFDARCMSHTAHAVLPCGYSLDVLCVFSCCLGICY